MNAPSDRPPNTILGLLAAQAARSGNATAIQAPEGLQISYAELLERVSALAASLRAAGLAPTDRVAIVLPNGLDMAMALLGVSCACVAVPLNPAYKEAEYEAYFSETKSGHLLVLEHKAPAARAAAQKLGLHIIELAAGGRLANKAGCPETDLTKVAAPSPDSVAMILLTSGSTGRPKRVPLTHRNLCTSAAHVRESLVLGPGDRCLSMWEQHHIGGLVDLLLAPLSSGGSVICAGSFDAGRFHELLGKLSPTWFQGVPTTLRELMVYGKARFNPLPRHSLRFMRSVAAALPPSLMEEIEQYFGVPVIQTFGMTEASPLITTNLLPPGLRKPGSAGKTCGPEVAIMDERGNPLGTGAYGEVAVRGENIFSGYEDNAEANAAVFRNGWFYTGDTGYLDEDGYLFLRGRVKEMINRGGEKISPYEVEDAISRHPGVSQAAVFSIPHPTLGEDVGAAIVPRAGNTPSEASIREFAAERLSAFKVPRTIMFLDALPKCPVGKVRRQELAELAVRSRETGGFSAPQNALEAFLAKLWAAELDLPQVGIDDDFSALGGDSLSSIRLLAAIDKLLGLNFPDDELEHFTTVRKMARHIESTGFAFDERHHPAGIEAEINSALASVTTVDGFAAHQLAETRTRMKNSRNLREFRTLRESLLHRMTPAELVTFAGEKPHALSTFGRFVARIPKGPASWRVPIEFHSWVSRTSSEVSGAPGASQWVRHPLSENMDLFTADPSLAPDKTLIVGFTGNVNRLMMPIYRFLLHLDPASSDLLLLRDPNRAHYARGIPGTSGDIGTLSDWLRKHVEEKGYRRVISIGTSAGGLASLCAGLANGWDKAISIGGDAPSTHPELGQFLADASRSNHSTRVMLFYGALNERDRAGAQDISRLLPTAARVGDDSLATHNFLNNAYRQGKLKHIFGTLLD